MADDHPFLRAGLRTLLEARGWEIVGEASEGFAAVERVLATNPHLAILDMRMPGLNGLEATREIIRREKSTKILILTVDQSDSLIREALAAGARGVMWKSNAAHDLVAAVEAIWNNKLFVTPIEEAIVESRLRKKSTEASGTGRLTGRQVEVLRLIVGGKTATEIGFALGMSAKTVETHRTNMMRRSGTHSAAELVRYALRNKIVEP
ncbi:MAG: response regulator transcription factor [Candidatus Acidiferrum sp.]